MAQTDTQTHRRTWRLYDQLGPVGPSWRKFEPLGKYLTFRNRPLKRSTEGTFLWKRNQGNDQGRLMNVTQSKKTTAVYFEVSPTPSSYASDMNECQLSICKPVRSCNQINLYSKVFTSYLSIGWASLKYIWEGSFQSNKAYFPSS